METYDSLLHPTDAFVEEKDGIVGNMSETYLRKYSGDIAKRIDKTYFIFDSTPDVTYEFFKKKGIPMQDRNGILEEYYDYKAKYNSYIGEAELDYCHTLCHALRLPKTKIADLFYRLKELDIGCYSSEALALSERSEFEKEHFRLRQEAYKQECMQLGILPFDNSFMIDNLLELKRRNIERAKERVIRDTKFGQRLKADAIARTGVNISSALLASMLYQEGTGSTVRTVRGDTNEEMIISHIPVVKNAITGHADLALMMQLRQIAEINARGIGLDLESDGTYKTFNDLRTTSNALADASYFESLPIFAPHSPLLPDGSNTILLPYVDDFLIKHQGSLNEFGIVGNTSGVEASYGQNARKLGRVLNEMSRGLDLNSSKKIKGEIIDESIGAMEETFQKRLTMRKPDVPTDPHGSGSGR